MEFAAAMLIALALDLLIGWPDRVFARIGHPVTWIGALVTGLERRLNRAADTPARRRRMGRVTLFAVTGAAALPALLAQLLLPGGFAGVLVTGILAWPLVALRSLHDHVAAVAAPLETGDMETARHAVSMIVGRDPSRLDAAGIARAGLESLAENASDGVVAPVVWGAVLGLPGIAAYKAINTLDSMIGHRTPRYEDFGRASARTDDLVNLIPARLTGLLLALGAGRAGAVLRIMRRDARHHRSPNAGWPEAAMAAGLGCRLSGPRIYADRVAEEPWINAAAPDPAPADLRRGLALYARAMGLMAMLLLLLALI